jgi:hypothetical protein
MMIKRVCLGLLLLTTGIVKAQDEAGSKIGIKAGLNLSNYYVHDVNDQDLKTGFHVGIFLKSPINERVSFCPEILFSQKGSTLYYDNSFAKGTLDLTTNYIDAPLLFRVDLVPGFYITAGPYLSFLVNASVKDANPNGTAKFEKELDKTDFNEFDWGMSGGLGFEFGAFNIGARYNYGFVTVGKERTNILGQTSRYPDGKNSVTQLFVGFAFN